jgi:hypothetical protein
LVEALLAALAGAMSAPEWLALPSPHLPTILATAVTALPPTYPRLEGVYAAAGEALALAAGALPPQCTARAVVFAAGRTIGTAGIALGEGTLARGCCVGLIGRVAPAAVMCLCGGEDAAEAKGDPKAEAFKVVLVAFNLAGEESRGGILEVFVPILARLTEEGTPAHLTQLATATITSMASNPLFKAPLPTLPLTRSTLPGWTPSPSPLPCRGLRLSCKASPTR